jgi:hypothetical protein
VARGSSSDGASIGVLRVEGHRELIAALRAFDESLTDIVRVANRKAADVVVTKAKAYAPSVSRQAGAAAQTLRSSEELRAASVRLGNKGRPFALGSEFGAKRDRMRKVRTESGAERFMVGWRQFPTWRGNGEQAGYWLWPTVRRNRDEIVEAYRDQLDKTATRYFPDGVPWR